MKVKHNMRFTIKNENAEIG